MMDVDDYTASLRDICSVTIRNYNKFVAASPWSSMTRVMNYGKSILPDLDRRPVKIRPSEFDIQSHFCAGSNSKSICLTFNDEIRWSVSSLDIIPFLTLIEMEYKVDYIVNYINKPAKNKRPVNMLGSFSSIDRMKFNDSLIIKRMWINMTK